MIKQYGRALNFIYFHRRRILVGASFSSVYALACYKSVNSPAEVIRMGIAGSLAHTIVETSFHFVDTVNVRTKVSDK